MQCKRSLHGHNSQCTAFKGPRILISRYSLSCGKRMQECNPLEVGAQALCTPDAIWHDPKCGVLVRVEQIPCSYTSHMYVCRFTRFSNTNNFDRRFTYLHLFRKTGRYARRAFYTEVTSFLYQTPWLLHFMQATILVLDQGLSLKLCGGMCGGRRTEVAHERAMRRKGMCAMHVTAAVASFLSCHLVFLRAPMARKTSYLLARSSGH